MWQKTAKIVALTIILALTSCAKRGTITGGLKDTLAPVLKSSYPKNFSTQFKGNKIRLNFDEYVKLKNLNKQLIVSPPMKNDPIITPSFASKFIDIQIVDTLENNTTYSFNFGQSIADNNEGNTLNQFKYVFSTGNHIDSLSLNGRIKDAYNKEVDNFVSVMLYEVNENYKDSIIYKQTPRYVTNTLDSLLTFKLENLKAGKYMLLALKDKASNNRFNPKDDKIGFIKEPITIPNDTIYELELFKEKLPLKAYKPTQASGNRLLLGYDGKQNFKKDTPKIIVTKNNEEIPAIITQFPKKDSLQIWYKGIKSDTLKVVVSNVTYNKDFLVRVKDQKKDTLTLTTTQNGLLNFRERFSLKASTPLVKFDTTKIKITNKDSIAVSFTTEYDVFDQEYFIDFKKEPVEKYNIELLPEALTDFYDKTNDTLKYSLSTREYSDYGNLRIVLKNAKQFPVIIELVNAKGDQVYASAYSEGETNIDFSLLMPNVVTLRAIYDSNKNREYDAGNFLEKKYAEQVIYFSKEIDIRANWDVEQVFDLSTPYAPEPKKQTVKKKKETDKKKKKRNNSIF